MDENTIKLLDEMAKALAAMNENIMNLMTAVQNLTQVAVEHKHRIEKLENNSFDEFH